MSNRIVPAEVTNFNHEPIIVDALSSIDTIEHSFDIQRVLTSSTSVIPQTTETNEPTLTPEQQAAFFTPLKNRFDNTSAHYTRPKNVQYEQVQTALENNPSAMYKLYLLEQLGGQVDVMAVENNELVFAEMSKEAPQGEGRRSINYQQAVEFLQTIGVSMMTPQQYEEVLQKLGQFDRDTWVWLHTEADLLSEGCALCGNRDGREVNVWLDNARIRDGNHGVRGVLRVQI